jgi:1-hydroxycarotenoid 3,4-desaturase
MLEHVRTRPQADGRLADAARPRSLPLIMRGSPVIVIGAGVGGLSAAALVAAAHEPVLVLERQAAPGGKLRRVHAGGAAIDAGPTVFTMRWVFDRLFEEAGDDFASAVKLTPARTLARHAWDASGHFDLFADREESEAAIGDFFGAREAEGYRRFCHEAERIYDVLRAPFMDNTRPTPFSLMARIGLRHLPSALAIRPHQALWHAVSRHFTDPRLRQLFGRYATYCGASPYSAPATLMLIAHVERAGVWLADDGMHAIAQAIEALAVRNGTQFRYDADVVEIMVEAGRACGVRLKDGETIRGRAVICNGDPAAIATGRFGDDVSRAVSAPPASRRSLSSLTWMINARTSGFPLARHNVFFSGNYRAEFDAIFGHGRLPGQPTVYVCAQDRNDHGGVGPPGPERLQLIVNAPANGDTNGTSLAEIEACETQTFDFLASCGLTIDRHSGSSVRVTPVDYEALFPATGGALYGQANHGWRAPFQRPGPATRVPGLYLAGGGTHPGAGIPMASLSGRLAAERVLADLRSMRSSRRAAMHGGMLTR